MNSSSGKKSWWKNVRRWLMLQWNALLPSATREVDIRVIDTATAQREQDLAALDRFWPNHNPSAAIGVVSSVVRNEDGTITVSARVDSPNLAAAFARASAACRSLAAALDGLPVLAECEARRWVHPRRGRGRGVPLWLRINAVKNARYVIADEAEYDAAMQLAEAACATESDVAYTRYVDLTSADGPLHMPIVWFCECGICNSPTAFKCLRCGALPPATSQG